MYLSELSIKRPVLSMVISLLLIVFGAISYMRLTLREYPEVTQPIISIKTEYPGANVSVIEERITKVIEDRITSVNGIKSINSSTINGSSDITIQFHLGTDLNAAEGEIRTVLARAIKNFPKEVEDPVISKVKSRSRPIIWIEIISDTLSKESLTSYVEDYIKDRFTTLDGVANVWIFGREKPEMRIILDAKKMAALKITVTDIIKILEEENIELPLGSVKSSTRELYLRLNKSYVNEEDFKKLVIKRGNSGELVRLSQVAEVKFETSENEKRDIRSNKKPMIGAGIVKQADANALDVSKSVRNVVAELESVLPQSIKMNLNYDQSIFIKKAIFEVYKTLFISIIIVVVIIYLFLGSIKATFIPCVTIPISLTASFMLLYYFGYSLNLLTLLALVLAIGLIVDDAIVMLESIYYHIEKGKHPLIAAYYGSRQVGFAVIATSLVLIASFLPMGLMEGAMGKLFREFSITLNATIIFSTLVALTLSPTLCSLLLKKPQKQNIIIKSVNYSFAVVENFYLKILKFAFKRVWMVIIGSVVLFAAGSYLLKFIPTELIPKEDRGFVITVVETQPGLSYEYTKQDILKIEDDLMKLVTEDKVANTVIAAIEKSDSFIVIVLNDWNERKNVRDEDIIQIIKPKINRYPSIAAYPFTYNPIRELIGTGGGSSTGSLQFVIQGTDLDEITKWSEILVNKAKENKNLLYVSYQKNLSPQIVSYIDREKAYDLGVSTKAIASTLQTMLSYIKVNTLIRDNREHDIVLELEAGDKQTVRDLDNIYIYGKSERGENLMIPITSIVKFEEKAEADKIIRYNRLKSVQMFSSLKQGYSLGEAVEYFDNLAQEILPEGLTIAYQGEVLQYQESKKSMYFILIITMIIVFLILAAQFESFIHPFIIIITVPFAIIAALSGLFLFNQTLNIYSQVGIIMLIGLAAKNGILIVEFVNQLRSRGYSFEAALVKGSIRRFRPIIMTSITTIFGTIPLILASSAGAESRIVLGIVIASGVSIATIVTLILVPSIYLLLARRTKHPDQITKELNILLKKR